jgi:hypothetical protein
MKTVTEKEPKGNIVTKYSSLSLWGYIDDCTIEGFKTPVFKNGGAYQLQSVNSTDTVISFEEYDASDDRDIIRPNTNIGHHVSSISYPAIYFFRPLMEEAIVGRKYIMKPKIRQWLASQDSVSPATAFDVLLFIQAPEEKILSSLENLLNYMDFPTTESRQRYKKRLVRLIGRESQQAKSDYSDAFPLGNTEREVNVQFFVDKLDQRISEQNSNEIDRLVDFRNWFSNWDADNEDIGRPLNSFQVRKLFSKLAEAEDDNPDIAEARHLLRYVYYVDLVERLCTRNMALFRGGRGGGF